MQNFKTPTLEGLRDERHVEIPIVCGIKVVEVCFVKALAAALNSDTPVSDKFNSVKRKADLEKQSPAGKPPRI